MYRVSFDPRERQGDIIVNLFTVEEEYFSETLRLYRRAVLSGLSFSPFIKSLEPGDRLGDIEIEAGVRGIVTPCSVTIDGVLLKSGVPVRPRFGGAVEVKDGEPVRFTDILLYSSTTIDPLEVMMSQDVTSVTEVMNTGSGKILANMREAPMSARNYIEQVLENLTKTGFSGILEVGEPNTEVLGVPVERDHLGIVVIGGTNPIAVVQEYGIPVRSRALAALLDVKELTHIEEIDLD